MICNNCGKKMICDNSREDNNVRWRTYWCPQCFNRIGTQESIGDYKLIRNNVKAVNTAHKLKREVRYAI